MEPNAGLLTDLLKTYLDVCASGIGNVLPAAKILLGKLVALELILLGLAWALTGADALVGLIKKILVIGFFLFAIETYPILLKSVIDGFTVGAEIAAKGGGAAGVANKPLIEDPSQIIRHAIESTTPIFQMARDRMSLWGTGFFDPLMTCISVFIIVLSYFVMAIQIFVTRVEFGIFATLGLLLVPFGIFKHTAFIAEKVFGGIIAFGVKLMVLTFVLEIGFPIIQNYVMPAEVSIPNMLQMIVAPLSLLLLSLHAPGVAAGLLSGSPSLTAGTAVGAAAGVTAAGVMGITAAGAASSPTMRTGMRAVAQAAGGVQEGWTNGGWQSAVKGGASAAASAVSEPIRSALGRMSNTASDNVAVGRERASKLSKGAIGGGETSVTTTGNSAASEHTRTGSGRSINGGQDSDVNLGISKRVEGGAPSGGFTSNLSNGASSATSSNKDQTAQASKIDEGTQQSTSTSGAMPGAGLEKQSQSSNVSSATGTASQTPLSEQIGVTRRPRFYGGKEQIGVLASHLATRPAMPQSSTLAKLPGDDDSLL